LLGEVLAHGSNGAQSESDSTTREIIGLEADPSRSAADA
jgi:hypothetical protein